MLPNFFYGIQSPTLGGVACEGIVVVIDEDRGTTSPDDQPSGHWRVDAAGDQAHYLS